MTPLLLLAALLAPPPIPPAPAIRTPAAPSSPVGPMPVPLLFVWNAGIATCDGTNQAVTMPADPRPVAGYALSFDTTRIVALTFAIDGTGRPHKITRDRPVPRYADERDDLVPAFAASRFIPGPPRTGCTVRFFRTGTPIADAPLQSVYAATIPPMPDRMPALFDRTRPAGATCHLRPLEPLRIMVPSFRTIPKIPGRPSWSIVRFDIGGDGRTIRPVTLAGSGNAALDAAGRAAVSDTRFERGARIGCLSPYGHNGATLPAPATPAGIDASPPGSTCPDGLPWADPLTLRFPENFRRRSIEGWAAIAYDVASWGQTGNIRVIAAEPAADFGEAAVRLIQTGSKRPSPSGYTGCTVIVRYRMGDDATPVTAEPLPPF